MAVPFGFGSWVDEGNEDVAAAAARQAAAERVSRAARSPRKEGLATKLPEAIGHIPMGMVGAAAGLFDAHMDAFDEQFPLQSRAMRAGKPLTISTDYNPSKIAGALNAETALNVMGLPGILASSPATLASGAIRRTRDGIPGIRYADQGSRTFGDATKMIEKYGSREAALDAAKERRDAAAKTFGASADRIYWEKTVKSLQNPETSNYVLFDDSLVDILRKYALPGAVGAGGFGSLTPGGDQ